MKIAVLHGAIINAGDFLIKNRAISLLKYFYPDSEIVDIIEIRVWKKNFQK